MTIGFFPDGNAPNGRGNLDMYCDSMEMATVLELLPNTSLSKRARVGKGVMGSPTFDTYTRLHPLPVDPRSSQRQRSRMMFESTNTTVGTAGGSISDFSRQSGPRFLRPFVGPPLSLPPALLPQHGVHAMAWAETSDQSSPTSKRDAALPPHVRASIAVVALPAAHKCDHDAANTSMKTRSTHFGDSIDITGGGDSSSSRLKRDLQAHVPPRLSMGLQPTAVARGSRGASIKQGARNASLFKEIKFGFEKVREKTAKDNAEKECLIPGTMAFQGRLGSKGSNQGGPSLEVNSETSKPSILSGLKHQESKEERMARLNFQRKMRIQDGSQEVHQDRISKRQDVELAQESFHRYFAQKSGNAFHVGKLIEAAADFGVKARMRSEKLQLFQVISPFEDKTSISFGDFCKIVEEARGKLRNANHSTVFQAFNNVDVSHLGSLSVEQVMRIMVDMGMAPPLGSHDRMVMEAAVRELHSDSNGLIAYHEVEILISQAREQQERHRRRRERDLQARYGLTGELFNEFRDQVLELEHAFVLCDQDGSGSLDLDEIMNILTDFGLKDSAERCRNRETELGDERADNFFEELSLQAITFTNFLMVIRFLRAVDMEQKREEVETMFNSYDRDSSGELDIREVCQVLLELGLQPKTPREQVGMAQLIEEVDADGSGQLDIEEMLLMVQRIGEKVVQMRCAEDTQQALNLGFNRTQVYALRNSFEMLDADGGGVLSLSEVERAVQLMGWRIPHTKLQKIILDVDADGSGELDFREFLPFMRRVEQEFRDAGISMETKEDVPDKKESAPSIGRQPTETVSGIVKAKINIRDRVGQRAAGAGSKPSSFRG